MKKKLIALLMAVVMIADITGNTGAFAAENKEALSQEVISENDAPEDVMGN